MTILEQVQKKNIQHRSNKLLGKKILLRIDVNVSLGDNNSVDPGEDWRIIQSLKTINFLREQGACIILLAHIGRDPKLSLYPVFQYMKQFFTIGFMPHFNGEALQSAITNMKQGSVIMMENVRQYSDEKMNKVDYLKELINLSDLYINDAFAVSHRSHASVDAITRYLPSYFGLQFVEEISRLTEFINYKDGMKTLILGGAKFGTKLPLLEKLLPHLDYVLMGGALAHVFLKARGLSIGKSFCDNVDISSIAHSEKIILPIDYIDEHGDVADIYDVGFDNLILDIGPASSSLYEKIIENSGSIMWNGPLGKYEDGYTEASIAVANSIGYSESFSVTGGGDTSTIILEQNLVDSFDFISTGGGAMLDFLLHETLRGIKCVVHAED